VDAGGVHEVEVGEGELVVRVAVASHECFDGVERLRRERGEAADELGTEGGRFAVDVGEDLGDGRPRWRSRSRSSSSCRATRAAWRLLAAMGCVALDTNGEEPPFMHPITMRLWFARRVLADDPVFNPPENVFDLACADICVE
jgi:hypothetical protein